MLRLNFHALSILGDWLRAIFTRLYAAWPLSWRSVSALVLGVVLAKWFWIFLAPQTTFTASSALTSSSQDEGRLFGIVQTAGPASPSSSLPNIQLIGVFTASTGRRGFAIMKIDTKSQLGVAEGEDAAPGTKLVKVHADHVILERAGMKHRVDMINKPADSTQAYKSTGTTVANKPSGTPQAKKPGFFLKATPP